MNWNSELLRNLIKNTGMTRETAAAAIGIEKSKLDYYLAGHIPDISTLIKIADYFAVPLDYLCGRCSEEQANDILADYPKHFMELRRAPYESYLYGKRREEIHEKYEAPYPHNLLDDIFGDPVDWFVREEYLDQALNTLTEREREAIYCHYCDGLTYEVIGGIFNVSKERVRQIIAKAVRKLRHPSRSKIIRSGFHSFDEIDAYAVEKLSELNEREKKLNEQEAALKEYKDVVEFNEAGYSSAFDALKRAKWYIDEAVSSCAKIRPYELPECLNIVKKHNLTLEEMDLSVRSFNCLKRAGISTIDDIIAMNEDELKTVRNLGKRSYDEIMGKLRDMGFIMSECAEEKECG